MTTQSHLMWSGSVDPATISCTSLDQPLLLEGDDDRGHELLIFRDFRLFRCVQLTGCFDCFESNEPCTLGDSRERFCKHVCKHLFHPLSLFGHVPQLRDHSQNRAQRPDATKRYEHHAPPDQLVTPFLD